MQTFESSTLQNVGDSIQLEDERDGNTYTVKKLADGNVWMVDNIRIANKTITPADSNVSSEFAIPAYAKITSNTVNANGVTVDRGSSFGGSGYYSFYTVTAGTGGTSLTSGNAPSSICPKGWRLPTGGEGGEFQTLYSYYNSLERMLGVPKFDYYGGYSSGSFTGSGTTGYFWSSTITGANFANYMTFYNSLVYPVRESHKSNGFPIRCIAE